MSFYELPPNSYHHSLSSNAAVAKAVHTFAKLLTVCTIVDKTGTSETIPEELRTGVEKFSKVLSNTLSQKHPLSDYDWKQKRDNFEEKYKKVVHDEGFVKGLNALLADDSSLDKIIKCPHK